MFNLSRRRALVSAQEGRRICAAMIGCGSV